MDDLAKLAKSYHNPNAIKDKMVLSWWYDGEVTLEKGGELFRKRKMHTIESPVGKKVLPKEFGRVFVTEDQAKELSQKLQDLQS